MKKPSNLIYGLEDNPPLIIKILLALQHTALAFSGSCVIMLFTTLLNLSFYETMHIICVSLFINGVVVILHSLKNKYIGEGYFIISAPIQGC
ncbi:MAG TPA: hypothetical protein PKY81_10655 [bacterium]|nr:hypothetical protein [bacterium]